MFRRVSKLISLAQKYMPFYFDHLCMTCTSHMLYINIRKNYILECKYINSMLWGILTWLTSWNKKLLNLVMRHKMGKCLKHWLFYFSGNIVQISKVRKLIFIAFWQYKTKSELYFQELYYRINPLGGRKKERKQTPPRQTNSTTPNKHLFCFLVS